MPKHCTKARYKLSMGELGEASVIVEASIFYKNFIKAQCINYLRKKILHPVKIA